MLYKVIFKKRPTANKIKLHNSLSNTYLLDFAPYNEFAKAKVALRKQLEKEYKHLLKNNLSFRQYIDHITHYINTSGKKLYAKYLDRDAFIENSEVIEKDIVSRICKLYDEFPTIIEDCTNYLLSEGKYIYDAFNEVGLLKKIEKVCLKGLRSLRVGQIEIYVTFTLDEEAKKIFNDVIVDDWGHKIYCFQDVELFEDDKPIFGSVTHEDFYPDDFEVEEKEIW